MDRGSVSTDSFRRLFCEKKYYFRCFHACGGIYVDTSCFHHSGKKSSCRGKTASYGTGYCIVDSSCSIKC